MKFQVPGAVEKHQPIVRPEGQGHQPVRQPNQGQGGQAQGAGRAQ